MCDKETTCVIYVSNQRTGCAHRMFNLILSLWMNGIYQIYHYSSDMTQLQRSYLVIHFSLPSFFFLMRWHLKQRIKKHSMVHWFRKDTLNLKKVKLNSLVSFPLFLLPDRYRGLSGGKNTPGYQTCTGALQTYKTKWHIASRAVNRFTILLAVLQQ